MLLRTASRSCGGAFCRADSGTKPRSPPPRRRLGVLREVGGDISELRAGLQPLHHRLQLGRRLLGRRRVAARAVGRLRVPHGGDDDLRDAVRVLGAVELRAVRLEERRDVLVGHGDLRRDLTFEQLLHQQVAAQPLPHVAGRQVPLGQFPLEGVVRNVLAGFEIRGVELGVRHLDLQFPGLREEQFLDDEVVEDRELGRDGLLVGRRLRGLGVAPVGPLHGVTGDLTAVHHRPRVGGDGWGSRFGLARAAKAGQREREEPEQGGAADRGQQVIQHAPIVLATRPRVSQEDVAPAERETETAPAWVPHASESEAGAAGPSRGRGTVLLRLRLCHPPATIPTAALFEAAASSTWPSCSSRLRSAAYGTSCTAMPSSMARTAAVAARLARGS